MICNLVYFFSPTEEVRHNYNTRAHTHTQQSTQMHKTQVTKQTSKATIGLEGLHIRVQQVTQIKINGTCTGKYFNIFCMICEHMESLLIEKQENI